jgi:23S rRNA pseudouridine2457 synthase
LANRYILFNKPYGVLCQFSGGDRTLGDYVSVPEVYAAGRLDRDSEGLMLLTNDGELQHRLAEPRFGHQRTYCVQVERVPDEAALQKLASGLQIQGYRTRPAQVKLLDQDPSFPPRDPPIRFRKNVPTAWIELTLTEGRNRQVRHMTAAVGHPTLRLVRTAIGNLRLEGLKLGEWKELSRTELEILKASLSIR